jgi:hypothetical protein
MRSIKALETLYTINNLNHILHVIGYGYQNNASYLTDYMVKLTYKHFKHFKIKRPSMGKWNGKTYSYLLLGGYASKSYLTRKMRNIRLYIYEWMMCSPKTNFCKTQHGIPKTNFEKHKSKSFPSCIPIWEITFIEYIILDFLSKLFY